MNSSERVLTARDFRQVGEPPPIETIQKWYEGNPSPMFKRWAERWIKLLKLEVNQHGQIIDPEEF